MEGELRYPRSGGMAAGSSVSLVRVEMSHVRDRFSVILISKNSACVPLCFFSNQQSALCVLYNPLCKSFAFVPIRALFVIWLHNRILCTSGIAVVGVPCEQEGANHTTLGDSNYLSRKYF